MIVQPRVQGEIAIAPKIQENNEILNGIVSFIPLDYAKQMPSYIQLWNTPDPRINQQHARHAMDKTAGTRLHRIFEKFKPAQSRLQHQAFQLSMRLEQAPNPLSRVTLSDEKDELGVPRASLNWAFTSLEKKSVRKIYEIIGQQAGASGIGRVRLMEELWDENDDTLPATTSGGWHHMGTTRMSDDPKNGVVDANCKVHGIHNLFIAGASCFQPARELILLTIVALAIRLAGHIKDLMNSSTTT
jgi:choline dehydrogenase-like flavoprotein